MIITYEIFNYSYHVVLVGFFQPSWSMIHFFNLFLILVFLIKVLQMCFIAENDHSQVAVVAGEIKKRFF